MANPKKSISVQDLISFYDKGSFWNKSDETGNPELPTVSNQGYPTNMNTKLDVPATSSILPTNIYDFVYSFVTRITCDVIIDSDTGTLLTQRSKNASWPGLWHTIGSTKLQQETTVGSALRCLQNEIGLDASIEDLKFLENVEFPLRERTNEPGTYNNELSIFFHLYSPHLRLGSLRLDKNTNDVGLYVPDHSKKNYGLPGPMLPQHVYMLAKYSKHFESVRNIKE